MMRAIDLFCGAGGLSLGLEAAGFRTVLAVDCYQDACDTYAELIPGVDLRRQPIEQVDLRPFRGEVELLAGGPPCQPFSLGGKRLGSGDHRDMVPAFIAAIETLLPPVFLMENVEGLASGRGRPYLGVLLKAASDLGYDVVWRVLNAADYGVPQKRRRLFVIGSRAGVFRFPRARYGPAAGTPYRTAGEFLSKDVILGEPNPSKVFYARNPDPRPSPYGGHLFNGGGRPIDLAGLCPTILASAGGNKTPFLDTMDEVPRYHAELMQGKPPRSGVLPGARRITIQECALMQTFPHPMRFYGSRSSQYTQIGNAVPPLLAKRLGGALAALLGGPPDGHPSITEEQHEGVDRAYVLRVPI